MARIRQVVLGSLVFFVIAALPLLAARKPDTGNSQDGTFDNCGNGAGTCAFMGAKGTTTLTGTDKSGNPVTVAITLYDWGFYPCGDTSCNPVVNSSVIDVVLTGTDSAGIESLVVKGTLSNPTYVTCPFGTNGIGCDLDPIPDGSNLQQPTPIAGADNGANTRWDFGGVPPLVIPFDQISCDADFQTKICTGSPLGEAVLSLSNSVSANKLSAKASNYRVTLTDGTILGTLSILASPKTLAANNTQATATPITTATFKDYIDTSQAFPEVNTDGTMSYPQGFALAPVPPSSSPAFPSCYPAGETRTFRSVWYTYTPAGDGSITISTAGSRYDTLVYVFTGNVAQPTSIACDDDPPNSSLLQASIAFNVSKGTQYYIVVMEAPTTQTQDTGSLTGYPLSVDGALTFKFSFSNSPVKIITTTTLTSSPNPSLFGQPVTLTAKVTPFGAGTPTGTVTFTDGTTVLATLPLSGNAAILTTSDLPQGTNSITATYNGDANFYSSTSAVLNQSVMSATTTVLASTPNPAKPGQTVKLTATVTGTSGTPTGTVQFVLSDGTILGTSVLHTGVAKLTVKTFQLGFTSVTALYSGDSIDTPSTSNVLNQYVGLNALTILYSFTGGADGESPEGNLLQDAQGNFYGTTTYAGSGGGGTVFELDTLGKLSVLYGFTGTGGDGAHPFGSLLQDQGNFYGTTNGGGIACGLIGSYGCGTVFELSPPSGGNGSWTEKVLYSFTGTAGDGAFPLTRLVRDSVGNLYGTTSNGGNLNCLQSLYGCGVVFELSPPSGGNGPWTEKVIYTFTGGADGAVPQARLIKDGAGNLYGTASQGGIDCAIGFSYGCGVVFELSPPTGGTGPWTETVLYSFTGLAGDGANPLANVEWDSLGNLYGTTSDGGDLSCPQAFQQSGCGTVFELSPPAGGTGPWTENVVYRFSGIGNDGTYPQSNLVFGQKGDMYGTTTYGGPLGNGTVFKVTPAGVETVLCVFTGNGGDGSIPVSGLVQDSQGFLYGTNFQGGTSGQGAIYKLSKK